MLLLCALIVGSGSVWAQTYQDVLDQNDVTTTQGDQAVDKTYGSYTFTNTKQNSSAIRMYAYGIFTITAEPGYKITSVVFNAKTLPGTGKSFTVSPSSYTTSDEWAADTDVTYSGSGATSISFTSDSNGSWYFNSITINYAQIPPCTITLGDDSSVLTEASSGAGVNLPVRSNVADYTFVGWSKTNASTETTVSPTIIPSGTYHPSADATLYPVYKRSVVKTIAKDPAEVSISDYASANSWANSSRYFEVILNSDIKATVSGGSNAGTYNSSGKQWRIYQAGSDQITITADTGCELISVTFTYGTSNNGVLKDVSTSVSSGTTYNVSGSSKTFSAGSTSGTTGQVQFTNIVVNYKRTTTYYFTSVPVTTENASITTAEYATYCGERALDFSTTGITAYTAVDEETQVTLNEIADGKVPANTPVVLYKAGADGTPIDVPVIASIDPLTGTNDLRVSTGTDVDYMYVLSKKNSKVGFRAWNATTDLSAGKIYLLGKASYAAREFIEIGGETTGVNEVRSKMSEEKGEYFDLQGRKVAQPTKGLYIVNGKKVIIK